MFHYICASELLAKTCQLEVLWQQNDAQSFLESARCEGRAAQGHVGKLALPVPVWATRLHIVTSLCVAVLQAESNRSVELKKNWKWFA